LGKQSSATGNVALLCAALIGITNIYVSPIYGGTSGFVVMFLLLLITALVVPVVQLIPKNSVKFVVYIFLGFSAYWTVGAATDLAYSTDLFLSFKYISGSFGFLPIAILAMANAIVVLIAIVDSPRYGYGFAWMGFALVVYNIAQTSNLDFVGGRPDLLLLVLVLSSLIPSLWCYLTAGAARNLKFSALNRFYTAVKAGFLTLAVFTLLVTIVTISQHQNIDNFSEVGEFFSVSSGDLLTLCWYYLLSHVAFVMVVFFANNLVLNAFDIEKEITETGDVVYHRAATEGYEEDEAEEENPYDPIIKEMKMFQDEFRKKNPNKLVCVQKIGKFKNELDLLVSKYEYGTKDDAEKILHQIEKNIEFAFK
jgi:hypothetical protein